MPVLNPKALVADRVEAIRKYHADTGIKRAELDVSGGIDSAVMAGLLVLALGAENCTFAHLGINTDPKQTDRAKRLIQGMGAKLAVLDVTEEYSIMVNKIQASLLAAGFDIFEIERRLAKDPTILGSIRSCLRAPLGRAFNRITGGGIRHGTGNECEDRFLRFYQKGGDGEVDTNPIAMLSKAEVYQLAYELANHFDKLTKDKAIADFPQDSPLLESLKRAAETLDSQVKTAYYDTIGTIPSADLWGVGDKHNDESEIANWLGASFTYGRLDVTTGKVVNVGTIERVARFLDLPHRDGEIQMGVTNEYHMFDDDPRRPVSHIKTMTDAAEKSDLFTGFARPEVEALLLGARKAERQTRHKMNPNIPALGTRGKLVTLGILSDNFADYGI